MTMTDRISQRIFADRNLSREAVAVPAAGGAAKTLRVVPAAANAVRAAFQDSLFASDAQGFRVRVADWETPGDGDRLSAAGVDYIVVGAPAAVNHGVEWLFVCRPAAAFEGAA